MFKKCNSRGIFPGLVVFLGVFFRKIAKCNSPGVSTVVCFYIIKTDLKGTQRQRQFGQRRQQCTSKIKYLFLVDNNTADIFFLLLKVKYSGGKCRAKQTLTFFQLAFFVQLF